jgi:hypothetical protein
MNTFWAKSIGIALVLMGAIGAGVAQADPDFSSFPALEGCTQITKKVGVKVSGRFGWKPLAAHFNAAVVVGPRLYNLPPDRNGPPRADIFSAADGRRILTNPTYGLYRKSYSICNGVGEDLCATTWLTPIGYPGARIESKYGAIIVRIRAAKGSNRGCRYYYVAEPSKRVQYENK